jgi:hypothetical protein
MTEYRIRQLRAERATSPFGLADLERLRAVVRAQDAELERLHARDEAAAAVERRLARHHWTTTGWDPKDCKVCAFADRVHEDDSS